MADITLVCRSGVNKKIFLVPPIRVIVTGTAEEERPVFQQPFGVPGMGSMAIDAAVAAGAGKMVVGAPQIFTDILLMAFQTDLLGNCGGGTIVADGAVIGKGLMPDCTDHSLIVAAMRIVTTLAGFYGHGEIFMHPGDVAFCMALPAQLVSSRVQELVVVRIVRAVAFLALPLGIGLMGVLGCFHQGFMTGETAFRVIAALHKPPAAC
jgi:hypothetical protein